MKKRNLIITAFLLIAVACVGVGFAAATDLLVNGNLSLSWTEFEDDADGDVYFSSDAAVIKDKSGAAIASGVTAAVNGTNNDQFDIKIDAGVMKDIGDKVVVLAKIHNEGTQTFSLAAPTCSAGATCYTVECVYLASADAASGASTINIASNGDVYALITVTVVDVPAGNQDLTNNAFSVTIQPTSVANTNP